MKPSDQDLTRQNEDVPGPDYDREERLDRHDYGNWPEVAGVILTIIIIWLTFAFTG